MCGISGKLNYREDVAVDAGLLRRMTRVMSHRGPDADGYYLQQNVGLGHRRLSIIDLSTGDQPLANEDQTIWVVFNGEIYNFQELRERLIKRGHVFRTKSDTEVLVHLYEEHGPEGVEQLRGMFAYAIWDTRRRRLFVARDRVGIKPLYYCDDGRTFWFASEQKSIVTDPSVRREVNVAAIRKFLAFHYLPGEETLFQGIRRLLPGHYLVADASGVSTHRYWDLRFPEERSAIPFDDAVRQLRDLLTSTVRDHMIADVPVGVLLSGGVDSSAIATLAVQSTDERVQTFTVGFDGAEVVDERPFARMVADRLGTEHYDISITAEDFWSFLPSYVWHMEDPVCEPPALALYYVSKLARQHVKVLLSGEGGDEAFAGYPNYPNMLKLDRIRSALGPFARPVGSLTARAGVWLVNERARRYGNALGRPLADCYYSRASGPTAFFQQRASEFFTPEFLDASRSIAPAQEIADLLKPAEKWGLLDQMLYLDTKTWLPDDLLVKADKMTMATSVELRVPLLDHVVMEFAASLPPDFKVGEGDTKRVLKAAFGPLLPPEVLTRKKAGFPVPYGTWLRNGLKERVEDILLSPQAASRGYFRTSEIRHLLQQDSRSGKLGKEIFSLLVIELWHRTFMDQLHSGSEG
ncbi:MAG TPA: asparagine synthase (glutamine-hydrolyzing) [Verrucomicrobiae bacterium]|nr:asparagine synthase (glutamine-hydrolyzing) [Verrucomicrobiae bacterium]